MRKTVRGTKGNKSDNGPNGKHAQIPTPKIAKSDKKRYTQTGETEKNTGDRKERGVQRRTTGTRGPGCFQLHRDARKGREQRDIQAVRKEPGRWSGKKPV